MIYLNFCERTWLWDDSHDVWGEAEIADRGRMCSAWAILPMSSLMNCLETNIKMETEVEVWMMNLPYAQCGQGGVQSHFKGCGGSKFSKFLYVDSFNGVFYCTQCV